MPPTSDDDLQESINQIEDEIKFLELEEADILQDLGELSESEARGRRESVMSHLASDVLNRKRFIENVCEIYRDDENRARHRPNVEVDVAKVIRSIYPHWQSGEIVHSVSLYIAVALSSITIAKFCSES